MRAAVVAVGTELLLGQIVDTNSSWMGQALAEAGIDSHLQVKVGDNLDRIVDVLRLALDRSDAVIVCGGLGPTQDDITREAIATVMGVGLRRDEDVLTRIKEMFAARGREMAASNARQAEVPDGAEVIPQTRGTAPGLICPVGTKVVYAVPGVPHEMTDMLVRAVIPDLQRRSGTTAAIVSRTLRTWGLAESTLAEVVAPRIEALDRRGGNPTIAFLASGIEGIKVRVTAKAPDRGAAVALLDAEEGELRAILGDLVFGIDDESMEHAVGKRLLAAGLTLAVAESLTGGLVASRLVNVPGSGDWFKGGVVAYDSEVKFSLLGVPRGPVVTADAARAMAEGVRRLTGADVGLATTGVAGPETQEDQPVGTVFLGMALPGEEADATEAHLPGDRDRVRQFSTISLLDQLRRRLPPP
ncbi:MAG TPA: competence/damage-inducible protein A [Acidimicrobiales bacterium]|nr:competence/damage-inducible protein A [Acidimicrobiales bacterium]